MVWSSPKERQDLKNAAPGEGPPAGALRAALEELLLRVLKVGSGMGLHAEDPKLPSLFGYTWMPVGLPPKQCPSP